MRPLGGRRRRRSAGASHHQRPGGRTESVPVARVHPGTPEQQRTDAVWRCPGWTGARADRCQLCGRI